MSTSITDSDPIITALAPLTPYSLTRVLAYLHCYAPRRLAGSRFLSVVHLRRLAGWVGLPAGYLRSLRQHRLLAAHIALLHGAGLVAGGASPIALTPTAFHWLQATPEQQLAELTAALNTTAWGEIVHALRLEQVLTADYLAYLSQQWTRLAERPRPPYARIMPADETRPKDAGLTNAPHWSLVMAGRVPPMLLFELLQLGDWTPGLDRMGTGEGAVAPGMVWPPQDGGVLTCTPLSIGAAIQQGYGLPRIEQLLATALDEPLPPALRALLQQWAHQAADYRLCVAPLLLTAQDEQLAAVLGQRRLRRYVLRQLGPRLALVQREIGPPLQRWLAAQGVSLAGTLPAEGEPAAPAGEARADPATLWLALRVFIGLGRLVPLPVPAPHAALAALTGQLPPGQAAELAALADNLVAELRAALRGRDAFFPPTEPPAAALLAQVQAAIAQEQQLEICYQALGEAVPRMRRIAPYYLEQRGQLYYLHAYCYLAEEARVFRLDRVHPGRGAG